MHTLKLIGGQNQQKLGGWEGGTGMPHTQETISHRWCLFPSSGDGEGCRPWIWRAERTLLPGAGAQGSDGSTLPDAVTSRGTSGSLTDELSAQAVLPQPQGLAWLYFAC